MIPDLFSAYRGQEAGHLELRAQINQARTIGLVGGNLVTNVRSENGGVFARYYDRGVFGAASYAGFEDQKVKAVIEEAKRNTGLLVSKLNPGRGPLQPAPTGFVGVKTDPRDPEQKVYLEFAQALDRYIAEKYPKLASRSVQVMVQSFETKLDVNDGTSTHRVLPRAHIYLGMTALDKNGVPVDARHTAGSGGWFDENFTSPEALFPALDELYESVMQKSEGIYPEAGECDVVLGASLAGILAHEAVGHTVESDLVLGGSVAGKCLNQRVASDKVTLVDFAHTAFGKQAPLPLWVDDEGTPCQDVTVIEDGILKGYLCNRLHAEMLNMPALGNGRAFAYSDEPLVRMRNTCIMPGTDKLEDMIASVDKGYYLLQWNNGQADSTSEFMFGVTQGYEIVNGKIGRAIRDTTISGVAFELLKTVSMVGDDMYWSANGTCGKKQPMPVAQGGPCLKCRINIGGR